MTTLLNNENAKENAILKLLSMAVFACKITNTYIAEREGLAHSDNPASSDANVQKDPTQINWAHGLDERTVESVLSN